MFNLIPNRKDLLDLADNFLDEFPPSSLAIQHFPVDIKENNTQYEIKADLPGYEKSDISLSYQNEFLTISAEKEKESEEMEDTGYFICKERLKRSVKRQFLLQNVDSEKITAAFDKGVLTVQLPKIEPDDIEKKQIPIQ
ncbi:Hsp20 family protein [Vagococcus humatus]|uniref:Type III effector protein n=1 Tax=Vagococcus humatus TaxID=1889241 RepID=A0A429Z9B3_9ENTE|nr:Hsp20 family protein [Vagococcus humatus]RST90284.1 type III effector protein [Vagococcus humatus]